MSDIVPSCPELNEQVSSSGVGSALHSPSCCWENSDVVVTHLVGQLMRAHGRCGQCVCQADNEVVQTFCAGARCKKNTIFLVRIFANVTIIFVFRKLFNRYTYIGLNPAKPYSCVMFDHLIQ